MSMLSMAFAVVFATLPALVNAFDLEAEFEKFLKLGDGAALSKSDFLALIEESYPGFEEQEGKYTSEFELDGPNAWEIARQSRAGSEDGSLEQIGCHRLGRPSLDRLAGVFAGTSRQDDVLSPSSTAAYATLLTFNDVRAGEIIPTPFPTEADYLLLCSISFAGSDLPRPDPDNLPFDFGRWMADTYFVPNEVSPSYEWPVFGYDPVAEPGKWWRAATQLTVYLQSDNTILYSFMFMVFAKDLEQS